MGNERLTVLIDGREALPVRAIPYVAGWQRFSPDVVANYLAHNFKLIWFDSNTALTAYRLSGGAPIAIRPRDWDEYVAKLAGFEDELSLQSPTDNIGYAAWRNGAVAKLRAGTFVWLDEFEEKDQAGRESDHYFAKKSDNAGEIYDKATYDKLTDEVLDFSPMLLNADTRAMVLEGFEDAVQDASIRTIPIAKDKALPVKAIAPVMLKTFKRNVLDPAIDKAIKAAGNMALADVYLQLKNLALEVETPFTGEVEGKALWYTNAADKPAKLSKAALGKRLKNRSK